MHFENSKPSARRQQSLEVTVTVTVIRTLAMAVFSMGERKALIAMLIARAQSSTYQQFGAMQVTRLARLGIADGKEIVKSLQLSCAPSHPVPYHSLSASTSSFSSFVSYLSVGELSPFFSFLSSLRGIDLYPRNNAGFYWLNLSIIRHSRLTISTHDPPPLSGNRKDSLSDALAGVRKAVLPTVKMSSR